MFRFLIVEDKLLEMLVGYLAKWFDGSNSDSAATVEDGLKLIRSASSEKRPYDAAILDLKLPMRAGVHPEIDDSLCREIQAIMSSTLVIHVTGYPTDPKVLDHLEAYHGGRNDPRSVIVNKGNTNWVDNLRTKAKARLYGDLIEQQIEDLFGSRARAAHAGLNMRTHRPSSERTSITMALSTLFGTIVAHWGDIDESQKERIRQTFHVDESKTPIQITMPS